MFWITVFAFSVIWCNALCYRAALTDVTPTGQNQELSHVVAELTRRLDELETANKILTNRVAILESTQCKSCDVIYNVTTTTTPDNADDSGKPPGVTVFDSSADKRSLRLAAGTSSTTVAFHASLIRMLNDPGVGHTIIFNSALTNIGSDYHPNTGIFICGQAGVHVFSWTITSNGLKGNVFTDLVRNGGTIGYAIATSSNLYQYGTGSATVAVYLNTGDEVWVRVAGHSTGAAIRYTQTMFSGFRIQ